MRKQCSHLDEMQEQKMLKIEHNGCWFAFWALLICQAVQLLLNLDKPDLFQKIAGEWIVFLILAVYLAISYLRNGIWNRNANPTPKGNLIGSSIAAGITGLLFFAATYFRYHRLLGSIATGIFMFFLVFTLVYCALCASAWLYKKRLRTFDEQADAKEYEEMNADPLQESKKGTQE